MHRRRIDTAANFAANFAATFAITVLCAGSAAAAPDLVLHYDKPAAVWTEALPVGNGRLGAMVFGRPGEELLQLNEATLWSGGPVARNLNPGAPAALAGARQALAGGDYAGATRGPARCRDRTRKATSRWATW